MNLDNFSKNNESMTIEFWDNGTEFMGLGDFQSPPVRSKADKSYSYTVSLLLSDEISDVFVYRRAQFHRFFHLVKIALFLLTSPPALEHVG